MKKFEYQTKVIDTKFSWRGKVNTEGFNQILNDMGREGWELVEVTASNQGFGNTESFICIFKRETA